MAVSVNSNMSPHFGLIYGKGFGSADPNLVATSVMDET